MNPFRKIFKYALWLSKINELFYITISVNEIELLDQIENELKVLSYSAYQDIKNTQKEDELEKLRVSLLGKKGKLSNILKNMRNLDDKDRPKIGQKANILKTNLL